MYHEICVWFKMRNLQASQISSFFSRLSVVARTTKKEVIKDEDLESVIAMIAANKALASVHVLF